MISISDCYIRVTRFVSIIKQLLNVLKFLFVQESTERSVTTNVTYTEFNFNGFANYLEGIAGGNRSRETSKAIVADLKLFFLLTPANSSSYVDRLFNKSNLEGFFHTLITEREYKPTTITEKIRRLKMAIKYVMHTEDSLMKNQELFIRGSILLELMSQWSHSLAKAIALQRQQHSLKVIEELLLIVDPHEFLENQKVCSY